MEKIIEQAICLTTGCDATKFAEANETAYKIAERVAELADVRYKDALAKGREILNNDCSSESTKECCREIFPELKESEDERIRISIVETIKQCPDTFLNSKNRDRMLAYLERQKRQKPIFRVGDYVRNIKTGDKVLIEQLDIATKIYCYVSNDGAAEIHSDFPFSKQDEWEIIGQQVGQQPAECLKPEKGCWYVCIKDFYAGGKKQSSNGDLVQARGGMYMMGREDISEWFRKAYYDEIKPVEWSEEDEEHLDSIIESYKELLKDYKACHDIDYIPYNSNTVIRNVVDDVNFLKSLRPKPHTVSIKNATKFGNLEYERGVKDGIQNEKNRHWKPSEEQMDALFTCTSVGSFGHREALKSLYNDLKKL